MSEIPEIPKIKHVKHTPGLEIAITIAGLVFTLTATVIAGWQLASVLAANVAAGEWGSAAMHGLFAFIVAVLIYGGLVYQFARLSCVRRARQHRPASRAELERIFDGQAAPLSVLIPSYREEPRVVLTTVLSAAFQEYPNRRITLLIDDPPEPGNRDDAQQLEQTRRLPQQVKAMFEVPARRFSTALLAFERRVATGQLDVEKERARLQSCYRQAAHWFAAERDAWLRHDHIDDLFCERVLGAQASALQERAETIAAARVPQGNDFVAEARREYRRLASLFSVEVTTFERKRYQNLSHEPNKAMNLNSYIGLIGRSWREVAGPDGLLLQPASPGAADLEVAAAEFLITLDADSIIVPDYALRLVHQMQQPENRRLAVIQTPYSAVPGAPGTLERIAGATTDIQYIIHQGFTGWQSTFWVGANALLRRTALEAIVQHEEERGYTVSRYIQDRTVIEDTESSIDLVDRGWTLHNYPERLAFSATPPDFGSLLIQRRRWANGGLIILPKLLRFLARGPGKLRRLPQAFMRIHYLASIALVNTGLLIILAVPLTDGVQSLWLPLTALPYFALYTRDLMQLGYRGSDILRVYALNLVLIPVNLGGVGKSLQQAWTRAKIPFGRTPKVQGRTAAAPLYVAALYLLIGLWSVAAGFDVVAGRWAHAAFAAVNTAFLCYGLITFVGLRASIEDMSAGFVNRWQVARAPAAANPALASAQGEAFRTASPDPELRPAAPEQRQEAHQA